jgi:hypothetical protein
LALGSDGIEHFLLLGDRREAREIGVGMKDQRVLADPIESGTNPASVRPMTNAREDGIERVAHGDLAPPCGEEIDITVVGVLDLWSEVRDVRDLAEELPLEPPSERFARHEIVPDEVFAHEDPETTRAFHRWSDSALRE